MLNTSTQALSARLTAHMSKLPTTFNSTTQTGQALKSLQGQLCCLVVEHPATVNKSPNKALALNHTYASEAPPQNYLDKQMQAQLDITSCISMQICRHNDPIQAPNPDTQSRHRIQAQPDPMLNSNAYSVQPATSRSA